MEQYIVSARKYRPESFEALLGQDNIAKTLKNSILRGKLAHAYLFCGPRGVGKTSTARIFAKTINCLNPSADMEPCGECESCISFKEGRSYCIHELDAASNNGVEDIKTLMEQVQVPPQVGKYSVYIIDEVHMLSQQAFNAFLKTLEEPPAHAIFILATTEKHKILPTILSRCQTYDFNRISIKDAVYNLRNIADKEGITIDDESLHIIAQKADGAMRDALTIFDQSVAFCGTDIKYEDVIRNLNVLDYEYSFTLVNAFLKGDYAKALSIFDEILSKGFNALYFVASLSSHLRNLIVSKSSGLEALLELPESLKKRYAEQAGECSIKFLYNALAVTTQCEAGYKAAVNPRLHIEFALMKLSFLAADVPVFQEPKQALPVKNSVPVKPLEKEEVKPSAEETKEKNETEPTTETVQEPKPRRRLSKSASSLSLNAIQEEQQKQKEEVLPSEDDTKPLPDDEVIKAKWLEMAESYKNRPRLANTLTSSKLSIIEENGYKKVVFGVLNVAQQQWIQEKLLHNLEEQLQKFVGSSKLRLDVDVIPDNEVQKKAYMPGEKAKELMEANEEIKNLVSELALDVK